VSARAVDDDRVGNVYDKYGTTNPIARALMRGFLDAATELFDRARADSVLEVGCGEGRLAQHLFTHGRRPRRFVATDREIASISRDVDPAIERRVASAYALPFDDASFDLVVCCEVLEHLASPALALAEIARVARRGVLVSTPREPLWRLLNVARGAYLGALGNTPGHIQHFRSASLEALVSQSIRVTDRRSPVPWTILLGVPRHADAIARSR
jgi:ubiquinone/menaquinone biosynthesis C-methylase UbiE